MEFLIKNLHEEKKRFTEQMEDQRKNHQEELKNMMIANRIQAQEDRKAFIAENNDLKNSFAEMQFKLNEQNMNMVKKIADLAAENEEEKRKIRKDVKDEADEKIRAVTEEMKVKHDNEMKKLRGDLDKNIKEIVKNAENTGSDVTGVTARTGNAKYLPSQIQDTDNKRKKVEEPGFIESLLGGVVNAVGSVIGGVSRLVTPNCFVQ